MEASFTEPSSPARSPVPDRGGRDASLPGRGHRRTRTCTGPRRRDVILRFAVTVPPRPVTSAFAAKTRGSIRGDSFCLFAGLDAPASSEEMFADQWAALTHAGFSASLCSDEVLAGTKQLRNVPPGSQAVYRGWMVKADEYAALVQVIEQCGATAFTTQTNIWPHIICRIGIRCSRT